MPDHAAARHDVAHWPLAAGPPASAGIDETYASAAESVPLARASISGWLRALLVDDATIGDVALAVTEACTNVVVHGYRTGVEGAFRVVADRFAGSVRVTVTDGGCGMAPRPDSPGLGLGLPLMAGLADSLEVRPADDGRGTAVSMVFSTAVARESVSAPR